MSAQPLSAMSSRVVHLCGEGDLQPGEMRAFRPAGNEAIALYRLMEGYFATQDSCTHAKASLTEGWLDGDRISCPVHSAEFCIRTGRALCFPATVALKVYPVRVEAGQVYVVIFAAQSADIAAAVEK